MGPFYFQLQLPMALLGPIISAAPFSDDFAWAHYFMAGGAADALGRAHCVRSSSCRPLGLGPLIFRETLLMPWDGPILFSTTVADGFAWAHYICGTIFRWFRLGPLFYGGGAADALGRAHCARSSSCRPL